MDTAWFCVDGDGHVARFESGESGPVPDYSGALSDNVDLMPTLQARGLGVTTFDDPGREDFDPSGDPLANDPNSWWDYLYEMPGVLGLYEYGYDGWGSDVLKPYRRISSPQKPLHVDELPPDLAAQLRRGTLYDVSFAKGDPVQFAKEFGVQAWSMPIAYVDGKTVRPMPGAAQDYANLYAQLEVSDAFEAGLEYEQPTVEPNKKPIGPGEQGAVRKGSSSALIWWAGAGGTVVLGLIWWFSQR